ncbi:MAG: SprT family zinc-dependent metalloprotease [Lachnospiraceae bacterium]|nr:SprT family zinc-dependent metalloprotease [Lachnospiraceae bacterium]
MNISYQLIRSNRKTLSIEIKPDGQVLVRAPRRITKREIDQFLLSKSDWIEKHVRQAAERSAAAPKADILTPDEIRALANEALKDLPDRVRRFAPKVGVSYGGITIRNQKTRWGSCSSKGNLNFNCLLMLAPPEVRDYVVVHELCHRREMNHSPRFWAEVGRVLPDYEVQKAWLKEHGPAIMARMTG